MTKYVCCSLKADQIKQLENPDIPDEDAEKIFKAFTHPMRLKILRLLTVESEICNCDLTDIFDESQPMISKQLSKLEKDGLLARRNITFKNTKGRWHAYRLAEDKREIISYLLEPFTSKVFVKSSHESADVHQTETN
ncbi:MAG: ArsR/SmtB family transcription factor [Candidatus Hodarchaeales archaeon]|jgi:DNA-binding transcriptional ArsR family regulator